MTTRRRLLRGAGVVAAAGSAGCLGLFGNGGSGENGGSGRGSSSPGGRAGGEQSGDAAATPDPVAEKLVVAGRRVGVASDRLGTEIETFSGEGIGVDFDPRRVTDPLDDAERALSSIADPTTDQQAQIEAYRDLIAGLRSLATGMASLAEVLNAIERSQSRLEASRPESALAALSNTDQSLDDATSAFTTAETSLQEIDTDAFDGLSAEDIQPAVDGAARIRTAMSTIRSYLSGYEQLLEGVVAYTDAAELYTDSQYARAREMFQEAQVQFRTARSQFDSADELPFGDGGTGTDILVCVARALTDSAVYWADAAAARERGDTETATQRETQAQEAADRCDGPGV